jgi:hypothetical protein
LHEFPTVSRERAVAFLELAKEAVLAEGTLMNVCPASSSGRSRVTRFGRFLKPVGPARKTENYWLLRLPIRNRLVDLLPLVPALGEAIESIEPGEIVRLGV